MKRQKLRRKPDRKVFSQTADKTHVRNLRVNVMRGGYRI